MSNPFTIFVSVNSGLKFHQGDVQKYVRVSIWPRCSPSDRAAILEPMNTCRKSLGNTKQVAARNCQRETDLIDAKKMLL